MTRHLHTYTRACGLAEAVADFAKAVPGPDGEVTVAMAQAADAFAFAVVRDGALCLDAGGIADPAGIFELRAFNARAELRWLSEPGARGGRAAIVTVEPLALPDGWTDAPHPILAAEADRPPVDLRRHYVLWGRGAPDGNEPAGWSRLAEARVGALWVPLAGVPKDGMVRLAAVEHLAEDDAHGTVYVLDERLTGLEAYGPGKKKSAATPGEAG